jgi:hypothetical protein
MEHANLNSIESVKFSLRAEEEIIMGNLFDHIKVCVNQALEEISKIS